MEAKREILPRENGIYATQTTEGFTQQTTIREIPILLSPPDAGHDRFAMAAPTLDPGWDDWR